MLFRIKFEIDPLIDEMLSHIPDDQWISKDTTFFDPEIGGGQFLKAVENKLREYGHSDKNIAGRVYGMTSNSMRRSYAINKNKVLGTIWIGDFLEEEFEDMKFDNVISNPPYTQGTKYLYRYFFEKSLELSDNVVMVMPVKLDSNYDSLKTLNHLIKTHATFISENVSHHFNVGLNNIHYVVIDKNIINEYESYSDPLESYEIIFPDRKRLNPSLGNTALSDNSTTVDDGVMFIDKIYGGGVPIKRMVSDQLVKKAKQKISSKYAVFTNRTPSLGKFNVHIEKDYTSTWSLSVMAYEVETKKEATMLAEWLQSDIIVAEMQKMLLLKNTYSSSLEMIQRLPWYE